MLLRLGGIPPVQKVVAMATLDPIPCPVLRTLVNEGKLTLEPTPCQLYAAMRFLGLGRGVSAFLTAVAWFNTRCKLKDLHRCPIDHNADTRILRDGFQPEYLDRLLAYSRDGLHLTAADFAAAQHRQLQAEPGFLGRKAGAAEFVGLLYVFGETPHSISLAALTRLYRENRFPEGWRRRRVPTSVILARIVRFLFTPSRATL